MSAVSGDSSSSDVAGQRSSNTPTDGPSAVADVSSVASHSQPNPKPPVSRRDGFIRGKAASARDHLGGASEAEQRCKIAELPEGSRVIIGRLTRQGCECSEGGRRGRFQAQKEKSYVLSPVVQFSRRTRAQYHPKDEAQIKGTDVNPLPLEDVVPAPQIESSHSARPIAS